MSALISSLSIDILPLIIDLLTSQAIWLTPENTLTSLLQTKIMTLHMHLQNLKQRDDSISIYLGHTKAYSNELITTGFPLTLKDFNIYIFHGVHLEFKDIMITLLAYAIPISFKELYTLLLNMSSFIVMS